MNSTLRSLLIAFLLSILVIVPDISQVIVFSSNSGKNADSLERSTTVYPSNRVFLNQTFDNENTGKIPDGWYAANSQYGNITVANGGYGSTRKSAMIIDNSSVGTPGPYRYFAEQTKTIGISFAIEPTNNSGSNTVVGIFIDDGNLNGASIIFKDGKIMCRQNYDGIITLHSSYVPNRWYTIKLILNIPRNVYNVYIDDHLEAVDAGFLGACTQLNRIVFNETSGQDGLSMPVAYVDEILGRQVIEIPRDYSTIQEGINAASPHDVVFVTGQRTYYESVSITKSVELVGEDASTTTIDGSLSTPGSLLDGILIEANNVFVREFTIKSTPYGAGIRVWGSNNIIEDNIVANGLGDGISIIGSSNYLARNVIKTNTKCGVRISGSNCTLTDNTIIENDACGVLVSGSNCNVSDNFIGSNLDCGIWIATGDQSVLGNNTIKKNLVGVKCDATTNDNKIYQNRFIGNNRTPQAIDSGANKWDDGYPYNPDNKKGGGNYWSDLASVDRYSGADQSQRSCFLAPDGISDAPYSLSSQIQDRYPLFIIQGVTDDTKAKDKSDPCTLQYVDYDTGVLVTAYFLRNVTAANATIFAEYRLASNISHENVAMGISDPINNTWKGTIPGKKYGTMVTYNVSVHAELDTEVNSTNYPLLGPFSVEDHTAPNIASNGWIPSVPDNETTILVWTIVTEPNDASGVASVSLSYLFGNTWWTADMIRTNDDNYTALMPKQLGNTTVSYNITASDKAGNMRAIAGPGIRVLIVSTLSVNNTVTRMEPCDIDLGVMYRGEKRTDSHLTLSNVGQENLAWNIVAVNSGDWLKSILSPNGVLQAGKSTTVALSIDTTSCLDPNLYVTELTVIANGSIPRWVVLLRFIVRDTVIDDSWCSLPAPLRSNINDNATFAFHAKWTHNCTDAASGTVSVGGYGSPLTVNGTGWISFELSLLSAGSKTFSVSAVDFVYIKDNQTYHIKSFTQRAENLTAIWDRIKVILKVTDDRIDANSKADITWNSSVYEYDNSKFMGSIDLNDTLTKATVGRYSITASSINDTKYGLTAFQSNSVFCIWDKFKINVGGVSKKTTNVGEAETIWVMALYEYDNIVFKGANGTLYVDVYDLAYNESAQRWIWVWNRTDPLDFSSLYDRWEKSYSFDDPGPRRFVVSRLRPVEDRLYNLTAVNDLVVPPLDITWVDGRWTPWPDPLPDLTANNSSSTVPFPTQGSLEIPSWAVTAIIVTLAIGLTMIFAIIVVSGRQRTRKDIKHHVEDRHLK